MNWHEHQAIIFAHNDKAYAHVHVMLNVVHPETGLRLNDDFKRRRAQAWALEYEREQGRIHCEQRLLDPEQRERAAPRNIWMAFQENEKEFARSEEMLREQQPISPDEQKNHKNAEWKILKEIQRTQRAEFSQGKLEFSQVPSSIYREVREEFRDRWADYYGARRDGNDPDSLAALKAELVAEQKTVLNERRDEACKELRESRDERYRTLLDDQRAERSVLRQRQEANLDNALFLHDLGDRTAGARDGFRDAADEAAMPRSGGEPRDHAEHGIERSESDAGGTTTEPPDDTGVGLRVGVSVGSFLDALFFDLTTLGSAPPTPSPRREPGRPDPFEASAIEAHKQEQHRKQEEADAEWRQKQRPL
jgi:hypothetical protein